MKQVERFFRVQFGYGKGEFFTISEDELPRAIYAKLKGSMFKFKDGTAMKDGKSFISFDPDYHRHTGWNPTYEPSTSADFAEIRQFAPHYEGSIDKALNLAQEAIKTGNVLLLDQMQLTITA